jgi:hypothetical protein
LLLRKWWVWSSSRSAKSSTQSNMRRVV